MDCINCMRVDVGMINTVKNYLGDVSSISPSTETFLL